MIVNQINTSTKTKNVCILQFQHLWFILGASAEAAMEYLDTFDTLKLVVSKNNGPISPNTTTHVYPPWGKFSRPEESLVKFLERELRKHGKGFESQNLSLKKTEVCSFFTKQNLEVSSLKRLEVGGINVGMAIYSKLVKETKCSTPSLRHHLKILNKAYSSCIQIINYLNKNTLNFDEFWIWNGRTLHERVVVEWCKANHKQIKFLETMESFGIEDRWVMTSFSPHAREWQSLASNYAKQIEVDEALVDTWFKRRREKEINGFLKKQERGLGFDTKNRFVALFTSSDDEYTVISDSWESPWGNQIEAVMKIAASFEKGVIDGDDLMLLIRVHPNMMNKSKRDQLNWLKLGVAINKHFSRVKVIESNSEIDSYKLVEEAVGVIVFRSTVGLEATYLEKPVATIAPSRYDLICEIPNLGNEIDLNKWVNSLVTAEPAKGKRQGSIDWVKFRLTFGNAWCHVRKSEIGYFLGETSDFPLQPHVAITKLTLLYAKLMDVVPNFKWRFLESFSYYRFVVGQKWLLILNQIIGK